VSATAEPSFVLGSEDQITITVWRQDDLKTSAVIEPDGNIHMTLAGGVKAAGLTPSELARQIEQKLAPYIKEPKVNVAVTEISSRKVLVLGEVKTPGLYKMSADMNAWEAIAKAGGFGSDANRVHLVVVREQSDKVARAEVITMNSLSAQSTGGQVAPRLQNHDILYVMPMTVARVEKIMGRFDNIIRPFLSSASAIVIGKNAVDILQNKSSGSSQPVSISTQ